MTLAEEILALHRRVRVLKRVRAYRGREAELRAVQAELLALLERFWQERGLVR